jgi:hypothetical protein
MNKVFLIPTLALFLLTSCQKDLALDSNLQPQGLSISGKIDCPKGGMTLTPEEYLITLTDKNNVEKTTIPTTTGTYFFDNLEAGNSYSIKIVRKSYPNSLTFSSVGVEDFILKSNQKQALGLIAADVDRSGDVNAVDLLLLNNFIAKKTTSLPAGPWRIVPASYKFLNPNDPFGTGVTVVNDPLKNIQADVKNVDFIVLKAGDIDLENCQ